MVSVNLLPSLRYLPGPPTKLASGRRRSTVETTFRPSPALDPYLEGTDKAELDARRLNVEFGAGGDVLAHGAVTPGPLMPLRMEVISAWLRLREKIMSGAVGGANDRSAEGEVDAGGG